MQRYLVEVEQQSNERACRRIEDSIRALGSHFATHADWRSNNGVCTGRMIVEAPDRCAALTVVPPAMRRDAHVFSLQAEAG